MPTAISLHSSDCNTITMTGNISTTGTGAYGIMLVLAVIPTTQPYTGNITTTGDSAEAIYMNGG